MEKGSIQTPIDVTPLDPQLDSQYNSAYKSNTVITTAEKSTGNSKT